MDLEVYRNNNSSALSAEEQAAALGYVARQRYGLDEKDLKPRPEERQQRAVSLWVLERYDFLRVTSTCRYYYKKKMDQSLVFTPAVAKEDRELRNIVKDGYNAFGLAFTAGKIKNTVETLKEYVNMEKDSIDKNIVEIKDGWYWDIEKAEVTQTPSEACFVKLFDNAGHDVKEKYKVDTDEIVVQLTKKVCADTLCWLNKNDGVLPLPKSSGNINTEGMPELPYYDFINTWACGNEGIYNDILKATSAMFMKNKPIGAFILTGLMRNGKSPIMSETPVLSIPHDSAGDKIVWTKHGDLKPGDKVMSWEGEFATVTHTVPYKQQPIYRLTLQDGRTIEAAGEHLWAVVPHSRLSGHHPRVRDEKGRPTDKRYSIPIERYDPDMWDVKTTEEMLADYKGRLQKRKDGAHSRRYKYYLPPIHPVSLPAKTFSIPPHILGVILGDGSIHDNGTVKVDGMDLELVKEVTEREPVINQTKTAKSKNGIINYYGSTARFANEFINMGLAGKKSQDKFIPEEYLFGSIEQRYELLRGLLDTDGFMTPHGGINQVEFSTTSKRLADQVCSLVFSLGGTATVHERMGRYKLPDGSYKETRPNYRIFIRTLENPFSLLRKADRWKPQKRLGYVAITNIEFLRYEDCQCIAIDAPSHLYLAGKNFVPTHNTYVKMLHMIMGRANTSSVRLTELHDPHKNLTLLGTFLNAPDEEVEGKDLSEEATADFKSMSAHEELTLPVMYSSEPQPISTDFVMFCPMNDDPEWKGNSASACTQRSLIIPFYADLTAMDNNGHDFVAETFTPMMFQNLLGTLFAFAKYYKNKKMTFSSTMEKERKAASEVSDSRVTFATLFCKWFVGYTNENIVYDEYRAWCDHFDYKYTSKRKLMFAIDKVAHGRTRTRVVIENGEPQFATRLGGKSGYQFFADEYEVPALKRTVGSILYIERNFSDGEKIRSGNSVIVALEEWYAKNEMKKVEEQHELS